VLILDSNPKPLSRSIERWHSILTRSCSASSPSLSPSLLLASSTKQDQARQASQAAPERRGEAWVGVGKEIQTRPLLSSCSLPPHCHHHNTHYLSLSLSIYPVYVGACLSCPCRTPPCFLVLLLLLPFAPPSLFPLIVLANRTSISLRDIPVVSSYSASSSSSSSLSFVIAIVIVVLIVDAIGWSRSSRFS